MRFDVLQKSRWLVMSRYIYTPIYLRYELLHKNQYRIALHHQSAQSHPSLRTHQLSSTMKLLVFCVLALLRLSQVYTEIVPQSSESGNLKVFFRVLEKCGEVSDMGSCLKLKAVNLLDRALSIDAPLPVTDYLSIAKDPEVKDDIVKKTTNNVKSEIELEASLPKNLDEKSSTLDTMLEDRVSRFLRTRTIQFTLPADILEGKSVCPRACA